MSIFLNIRRMYSFGPKVGVAYMCLVEPNALQCLRSWTESDDFLARVRNAMQGTGGDEVNGEGFLEEIEELAYEHYEYAKRAAEV